MPVPSAAFYVKPVLAVYDLGVLGFSNSIVWKCPTPLILNHYNAHISGQHLDVGVGTGYFLDRCTLPMPEPALTLLDLNANSLATAGRRLLRYHPTTVLADVTAPVQPPTAPFDSIGINYLLHCLPGPMRRKSTAIGHLAALLRSGGVLFGTTVLGQGVMHSPLARVFLRVYNTLGVFSNLEDSAEDLREILKAHFHVVQVQVVGSVAFFMAHS